MTKILDFRIATVLFLPIIMFGCKTIQSTDPSVLTQRSIHTLSNEMVEAFNGRNKAMVLKSLSDEFELRTTHSCGEIRSFDRETYASYLDDIFYAAKLLDLNSEIQSIKIADDGQTAVVQARNIERVDYGGTVEVSYAEATIFIRVSDVTPLVYLVKLNCLSNVENNP
jgi:hypothetical protein